MADQVRNTASMIVGAVGIGLLLLGSLAYALWTSNQQFNVDEIQQTISEEINAQ